MHLLIFCKYLVDRLLRTFNERTTSSASKIAKNTTCTAPCHKKTGGRVRHGCVVPRWYFLLTNKNGSQLRITKQLTLLYLQMSYNYMFAITRNHTKLHLIQRIVIVIILFRRKHMELELETQAHLVYTSTATSEAFEAACSPNCRRLWITF